ncbi:MAG: hypothetical protein AB1896_12985 [Thermodesulfobacteriota bacterium]
MSPRRLKSTLGRPWGLLPLMVLLLPGLVSCGLVLHYSPIETYPIPAGAGAPNLETPARTLLHNLQASPDRLARELGRALERLPDVAGGPENEVAHALETIINLLDRANPSARRLLGQLARENDSPDLYGGPLEGLFWMILDGAFDPDRLDGWDRRTLLEYAWNRLERTLTQPQAVLDYLAAGYAYRPSLYSAQPKRKFFESKRGDCTEFSLLGGYLLEKLGYQVFALFTRPSVFGGHVAVIFGHGRELYLMDGSRVTLNRILRKKARTGDWDFLDLKVWEEVKGFDRIFGPEETVAELAAHYGRSPGERVKFKVIPFRDFEKYIEAHGNEREDWYRFDQD